ncbi:[protein-PII] uridylyltransferase [Nocardioides sp. Bht2]|uniref:[protein-PII] uridylyltransferase n=1 Tax=Nocardioides sp. Bht2 TaxID=3392297 RepID=UPI0039B66C2F
MSAVERAERTQAADTLCRDAYAAQDGPETGIALIAVGGYGRGELAPHSDIDVVLLHADDVDPGVLAEQLWYPLWDACHRLDHSVRSWSGVLEMAQTDLRVALGMLDARHLAGDPNLTLRLRTTLLAAWRRDARRRLPELQKMTDQRHEVTGELAHSSVPDVKEAEGGLRDATVLKALVATWLVDASNPDLERSRQALLDVRDLVHQVAGRATDRIAPEHWEPLAELLQVASPMEAQAQVRELGRRLAHLSRLTWRRVEAVLSGTAVRGTRRPHLVSLARGVAEVRGEVVLDGRVAPADDPILLLRAASVAAQRDLVLSPVTAARLARECPPLPDPWPAEARDLLVRMLAAGPALRAVWETLDETGALARVLPEWEQIRLLPHASAIHRFTVDRHVVETCIEASGLIRRVARPDVLVVAALLHDIGKGELGEHCQAGAPIARRIATRIGFDEVEVELIGTLVRWHLLLGDVATSRDPDDPATVAMVLDKVQSQEALELLAALTQADSLAASAKAWSSWRAALVHQLLTRCQQTLRARAAETTLPRALPPLVDVPDAVWRDPRQVGIEVTPTEDGSRVRVVSGDRVGLLADIAGMLAVQRIAVRAAKAWPQDEYGVSEWFTAAEDLDARILRERLQAIVDGRIEVSDRLRRALPDRLQPSVAVRPEASTSATVLEIRTEDRPGVVHLVCAALAELGISVRSAHVATLGPQAVDVFYMQELGAGALSDSRAAEAAHAVRAALDVGRGASAVG